MATASAPAAAPSATSRVPLVQRLLPAAATVVGVAVLLRLVYDQYLNYDARYALLWARDLARGLKPDYEADFAPTPHPLETAVSVLAVPFGDGADVLLVWLILLSFGLLVWLTYRLGAELFSPWVGVVAALVVLTRPALERDALLGYQDTAFAVLIVRGRAARGAAAAPRRSGARPARRGRSDAPGGMGAGRAVLALPVAGERLEPARAPRRPRRARPGAVGRARLVRHRRPAPLAARHRRPGRGGRPPAQSGAGAVLDGAVLRLRAARADRGRVPDRHLLRLALSHARRGAAARSRRGDDRSCS